MDGTKFFPDIINNSTFFLIVMEGMDVRDNLQTISNADCVFLGTLVYCIMMIY